MLKKAIAISVVLIILLHTLGFYAYFLVRLTEIRHEMRSALAFLPQERLTLLTIPKEEMNAAWLDEMEFNWKGKMYDIARVEYSGNVVRIFGLHDAAEGNLIAFIKKVNALANDDSSPVPSGIHKFLSLSFLVPFDNITIVRADLGQPLIAAYRLVLTPVDPSIDSPPPRLR